MKLKVGELAKRAGLTVRTLHHYDRIGLLSPSRRSDGGFRLFGKSDVVRLHRIQALKQFGFSLSDIGVLLDEPGASALELVTRQISVLDERVRRAQALRDRLFRLMGRISRGEDTGLTDWLTVLELMTMYEKHFSREELDKLRSNYSTGGLQGEWRRLIASARDAIDRGVSPESAEAQELAMRWIRLLKDTTGNDPELAGKLKLMRREEEEAQLLDGVTPEMIDYLTCSLAEARIARLAKYLTPGRLETVRTRLAAHAAEWPPLIAEMKRQMDRCAAPDNPTVQALALRWESLFRESWSGGDPELGEKIRRAFREEPDLPIAIGVDEPLIAFVRQAVGHLKSARESRENQTISLPKPSALRVATFRAVHQLLDVPPVFEDSLALKILGPVEEESLRADPSRYNSALFKGLRTSVAVRGRLAEDEWARSRRRGLRQYVILGAGLDTFAYRDEVRDGSRIFEVDLPTTQQWKRECLAAAGIGEPASLTFVTLDLEHSTILETLERSGFRPEAPAFFSWLGVTMYLEEEAVLETLRYIASLAPGSGVVLDYATDPSRLSPREHRAMEAISARTAERGEPWKAFFDPELLAQTLYSLGFREVTDYGPEQLNELYLSGRNDGLRKSGVSRLVYAAV